MIRVTIISIPAYLIFKQFLNLIKLSDIIILFTKEMRLKKVKFSRSHCWQW